MSRVGRRVVGKSNGSADGCQRRSWTIWAQREGGGGEIICVVRYAVYTVQ